MTEAQKQALKKALFYAQQDPQAVVDILEDILKGYTPKS